MPSAGACSGAFQEDDDLSPNTMAAPAAASDATRHAGLRSMTPATSDALLAAVLASLDDDKAEEIVQINLRGKSEIADWMVVCSGRSSRQVNAIAEKLTDRLKTEFGLTSKVEGKETGDWVLIDTGDIIVHVFRPEVREFYQLEKMWMPSSSDPAAAFR
jgi:ribosome-associated protein